MRDEPVGDLVVVLVIAAVAAVIGIAFGIFLLAPQISRLLDRADTDEEDNGDRSD
jgi:small neutral amino acid transporter SnatA (MarC family)